jgi:hypothetical protein
MRQTNGPLAGRTGDGSGVESTHAYAQRRERRKALQVSLGRPTAVEYRTTANLFHLLNFQPLNVSMLTENYIEQLKI